MNSNLKYRLKKHKTKIAVGVGAVVVIAVLIFFISLLVGKDNPNNFFTQKVDYANYYVVGNETSISLHNVSGNKVDELSYENIVYPNHLGDEMIFYADDAFYKVTAYEKKDSTTNEKSATFLTEKLFKYEGKSVADFVWNDQYVAVKRDNGSFEFFDRVSKETLYFTEVPAMDDFVLIDNYLVYTDGENIGSYDLNTKKSVTIHVGAETYGFGIKDGKVIAFNKFGNGNNTTSIFVLNPADLKIETLATESSKNVNPISSETSYFIKQGTNIVLTEVGADGKFTSITMNLKAGEEMFTQDNTLLMNEHLYANKDGMISIFSLKKKIMQKTINITGEYFCPLYVEA